MDAERAAVAELAPHECLALLRTAAIGRLAVSRPGHPEVFPVNFVVAHGTVLFRSAPGTKLDAIAADHDVTFEADGYDAASGEAWSVVLKGRAAELAGGYDLVEAAGLPLVPWQDSPKQRIVRILPDELTGRRFPVAPGVAPP